MATPIYVLFAVWAAVYLGFFVLSKNAPLKRKLWAPFVVVIFGSLFTYLVVAAPNSSGGMRLMMAFIGVLAIYLNVRAAQFCDGCGATLRSSAIWRKTICPKCGASLDP